MPGTVLHILVSCTLHSTLGNCQWYHLYFTNQKPEVRLTESLHGVRRRLMCVLWVAKRLPVFALLPRFPHLYNGKSYFPLHKFVVKISEWPCKKHLTQLPGIDLAKTAKGEPGSHYQIPLASWKLTPYTWAQHHWAVHLRWVWSWWKSYILKEEPTALMVIKNIA